MANLINTTAAQLLKSVSATIKKYEDMYRETGRAYNIFKVVGISEKEVIICRGLADLLNPKGPHYKGNAYLKLFMDEVVNPLIKNARNLDLSKAKVTTEYPITEDRRIDIVIEDGTVFIPVEVKINAGEQENQLADYAAFSKKMNADDGFIPVLFLTPDGRESSEASKDDYVRISFEKHIISWLEKCLNLEEKDKVSPVGEILKQFINAIKSFCGCEDGTMENAINALIKESRDSYAAALLISNAVKELDFDQKACEVFRDQVSNLVKKTLPDAEYLEEGKGNDEWDYLSIPIGHNCKLQINYDMISIAVESVNSKKVDAGTADKIIKTMSGFTGLRNGDWGENYIWACASAKYPGLEDIDIDNDDIYKFELYRLYSKDPRAAADKIVAMANALKNI